MKYLSCLLVAVFSVFQAMGQDQKNPKMELLNDRMEWSDGSILLADNTELKGMVKYNDHEGILSYNNGDNTRAFGPRSVLGFEFFDESKQRQRVFYTLDYESPEDNVRKPLFFELLREYKTFSVLVKYDPVQTERKAVMWNNPMDNAAGALNPSNNKTIRQTVVSQIETVYLMGLDGEIEAYFKNKVEQNGMRSIFTGKDDRVKNKILDRDLLEKYTGAELYAKLTAYANENDLKFRTQDDLLKILDYHKEQLKK
jgi:hypothetical protein